MKKLFYLGIGLLVLFETANVYFLVAGTTAYDFRGRGPDGTLVALGASQEFWHSWRTFQPGTATY